MLPYGFDFSLDLDPRATTIMYLDYNSTMAINSCPIPYLRVRVRVSTVAINSCPIPYLRVRVRVSTMAINSCPIPYLRVRVRVRVSTVAINSCPIPYLTILPGTLLFYRIGF